MASMDAPDGGLVQRNAVEEALDVAGDGVRICPCEEASGVNAARRGHAAVVEVACTVTAYAVASVAAARTSLLM